MFMFLRDMAFLRDITFLRDMTFLRAMIFLSVYDIPTRTPTYAYRGTDSPRWSGFTVIAFD